jgi:menaquinone-9 beta-reductase
MNLPGRAEIAVVGAGPAGSTLAADLARRGRSVVLLEGDRFPRDKVCGEFLSGESMDVIDALGWREAFEKLDGPTMTTARLTVPDGTTLAVDLPRRARGLSRRKLDAFLFDQARQMGVQGFDGAQVKNIEVLRDRKKRLRISTTGDHSGDLRKMDADLVVAAYGRRTAIDRKLARPFFQARSPWVAFKGHHRLSRPGCADDLRGVVELHAFDGGYCGASFVEEDRVNICTMFRADLLGAKGPADGGAPFTFLRRMDGPLGRRLRDLKPHFKQPLSVAQIPLGLKDLTCPTGDDIFFAGDAASMIAPLAGDGQAMAMESALILADLIDRHRPPVALERWNRLWRRRYARRIRLGILLNAALTRPRLSAPALRLLTGLPGLARLLVSSTRG